MIKNEYPKENLTVGKFIMILVVGAIITYFHNAIIICGCIALGLVLFLGGLFFCVHTLFNSNSHPVVRVAAGLAAVKMIKSLDGE